jgi:uncharacterized LabA/DUF88 family protein
MKKAVLFIDGNNLYHNLREMRVKPNNLDFLKFAKLICAHFNCEILEVRYYNSVPTLRDGKDTYFSHLKFIDDLRKIPRFTINTRKLQVHSTEELIKEKKELIEAMDLCAVCKPIVKETILDTIGNVKKKEKGVDVMIAVDFVDYAINNKADVLILISGDADFIPALELAKKSKSDVFSASLAKGYSRELREKFVFFAIGKNTLSDNCFKD